MIDAATGLGSGQYNAPFAHSFWVTKWENESAPAEKLLDRFALSPFQGAAAADVQFGSLRVSFATGVWMPYPQERTSRPVEIWVDGHSTSPSAAQPSASHGEGPKLGVASKQSMPRDAGTHALAARRFRQEAADSRRHQCLNASHSLARLPTGTGPGLEIGQRREST
jgi:hypothetical protein